MDRRGQAQGRFARVGREEPATESSAGPGEVIAADTPWSGDPPAAADPPIARHLEALALASMALGWECVQAADETGAQPCPDLDAEGLSPAIGPGSERPGSTSDWERFDSAWRRVRRELRARDLIGVGLALIDFAQACRITADRLVAGETAGETRR